jgi:hypothetical protein
MAAMGLALQFRKTISPVADPEVDHYCDKSFRDIRLKPTRSIGMRYSV